jgi:hypothetical protein
MYYEDEAIIFITTACYLLRRYESQSSQQNDHVKHYLGKPLSKGYVLKISNRGKLVLCKVCRLNSSTNYTYEKVISHSFNGKYSQITYIGKLLAVYLENLQKDEEENSNE